MLKEITEDLSSCRSTENKGRATCRGMKAKTRMSEMQAKASLKKKRQLSNGGGLLQLISVLPSGVTAASMMAGKHNCCCNCLVVVKMMQWLWKKLHWNDYHLTALLQGTWEELMRDFLISHSK